MLCRNFVAVFNRGHGFKGFLVVRLVPFAKLVL